MGVAVAVTAPHTCPRQQAPRVLRTGDRVTFHRARRVQLAVVALATFMVLRPFPAASALDLRLVPMTGVIVQQWDAGDPGPKAALSALGGIVGVDLPVVS